MQQTSFQAVKLEQIKNDLLSLSAEIASASRLALNTDPAPSLDGNVPAHVEDKSDSSDDRFFPSTPTSSRFSRFASNFKLSRQRSNKKSRPFFPKKEHYDRLDEAPVLSESPTTNDSRRGSDDSEKTLVHYGNRKLGYQSAENLLDLLAPLVSNLQRISIRLHAIHVSVEVEAKELEYGIVQNLFGTVTSQLTDLLSKFGQIESSVSSCHRLGQRDFSSNPRIEQEDHISEEFVDGHDLEMRTLMIQALMKKVQTEQGRHRPRPPISKTTNSDNDDPKHHSTKALLSRNPFIVHSTSVPLLPSARSTGITAPIKIGDKEKADKDEAREMNRDAGGISYSSFISNSQTSTWAMNVVRLGSYQASALFSPSPIAVMRLTGGTGREETMRR
ncbi:hypothetical protein IAR55_001561 [Kwoniella newhampshirensis]|uniref:Uncharacterized protein n=1 Tax=Kwoniella newhampshirensis TaxID=1651941 RepID=A0AAW0Z2P6_9TREE